MILDRDLRIEDSLEKVRKQLRKSGVSPHIWRRNELENYLLQPAAIARLSGASQGWVEQALADCADGLEEEVYAQIQAEYARSYRKARRDPKDAYRDAKKRADALWKDQARRGHVCGGKDLIRLLNGRLQEAGHKAVTSQGLAKELRKSEIPDEVSALLERIQEDV